VSYFHEVFHGVNAHEPQLKETSQALVLIAQNGLKDCRHVIDFARQESLRTNYPAQNFGAILNYVSRALADLRKGSAAVPAPQVVRPSATSQRETLRPELRAVGEARLARLTADQFQLRFEQASQELGKMYPNMARLLFDKGNTVHDKTIRARMIRRLAEEPMSLLIVDGVTDPEAIRRRVVAQNLPL
jgi:hypothetical protein